MLEHEAPLIYLLGQRTGVSLPYAGVYGLHQIFTPVYLLTHTFVVQYAIVTSLTTSSSMSACDSIDCGIFGCFLNPKQGLRLTP